MKIAPVHEEPLLDRDNGAWVTGLGIE